MVANTWLEGSYSELFPSIPQDAEGCSGSSSNSPSRAAFPSHAAPETPGSIHEGGELGYSLSHAYGAAFDNPDLIVACCVSVTARPRPVRWPPAGTRTSSSIPSRDGAVLPDPSPERLQDRRSHRARAHRQGGVGQPAYRIRLPTLFRRRARTGADASGDGRDARYGRRRDPAIQGGAGARFSKRGPAVADDRSPLSERLDRAQRGGRRADRRHVPRPSGAADQLCIEACPRPDSGRVDEELPARGAVRRGAR